MVHSSERDGDMTDIIFMVEQKNIFFGLQGMVNSAV
jgi:hypothetical protein